MFRFILFGILGLLISYIVWATAIFTKVTVTKSQFPETKIAYVSYLGDYSQAYKQTAIVEQKIKEKYGQDWTKQPCFGLYYDPPNTVNKSQMRSVVGKIVPESFNESIAPEGIYFGVIPSAPELIQVQYPLRFILSIFAGIYRSYNALNQYKIDNNKESKGAALEIYGYNGSQTLYAFPIETVNGLWTDFPKNKNE